MAGLIFDLVGKYAIEKGSAWRLALTRRAGPERTPVDLSGWEARLVIADALDPAAPAMELSTGSGHILLGGAAGTLQADLTGEETASIAAQRLRYRLYFTDPSGRETLFLRGRLGVLEADE